MQEKIPKLKLFLSSSVFLNISFFIVFFDQFYKYKIRHNGGFYICNKGISFGLFIQPFLFWLILGLFFLITLYYVKKIINSNRFSTTLIIGLTFIFGGTISNVFDRLIWGCVFDYILLPFNFFPVFNVADIMISLGAYLLVYTFLLKNTN